MPGNTENTDILTGINQIIEAINSLNSPTEVGGIVEAINLAAAQLNAISMTQYNLVLAIQALELQCQTTVNTTELHQTISCGGSGSEGAGTYSGEPSDQTTTPEDQEGPPPEGFESWSEFDQYQCDMAYLIINQMISDIAAGGILAATYTTIATFAPILVLTLLTPIGWAEIIIIVTLWISIWVFGVQVSLFSQLLTDNKEEFVCALLDGTSVNSSISSFAELVGSKVDGEATLGALPEAVRTQIKSLISSHASVDSINRLYEKTPIPPPGGNDCSSCSEIANIFRVCFIEFADYGEVITSTVTGECGTAVSCHSVYLRFNTTEEGAPTGNEVKVNLELVSGTLEDCGEEVSGNYYYYDTAGNVIGGILEAPDSDICCRSILVVSGGGAFSVRVNSTTICEA